jgi:hypothetical protein
VSVGEVVRNGLIAAFVAALIGGAARVIGLDAAHAVALGCGVLALVLFLLSQRSVVPSADLAPPDLDPPSGGRRDVEQLAWSMIEHRTHVRGIVLTRVRAIAARRLAQHGLDPRRPEDAAAIEALLGAAAWAPLRPDLDRPVSPRALDATLRALERLPPPEPLGPARALNPDRTSRAD